jgi:hypothetical protein
MSTVHTPPEATSGSAPSTNWRADQQPRLSGPPVSTDEELVGEWLRENGFAGAYEQFLALAVAVLPKGTTFASTLEMHPGNEPMVECVAMVPAGTNGVECHRRFVERWATLPLADRTAPIALVIRWSDL